MKNKQLKRLTSIIFIVLFMLILPVTGYYQGINHFVYAANYEIIAESSKYMLPIAGMMSAALQEDLSVENVSKQIDVLKDNVNEVFDNVSNMSMFINAALFTSLSADDINLALGTSYSQATINSFDIASIRLKIQNNEPLTLWDMQKLGINDIAAYGMKKGLFENARILPDDTVIFNNREVAIGEFAGFDVVYYVDNITSSLFDYIPGKIRGTQYITATTFGVDKFLLNGSYEININETYYKLIICLDLGNEDEFSRSFTNISNINILGSTNATGYGSGYNGYTSAKLYKLISNSWVELQSLDGISDTSITSIKYELLKMLGTHLGISFSNSEISSSSKLLGEYMFLTSEFENKLIGNYSGAIYIPAIGAGVLGEINTEDTSQTQAEKVIASSTAAVGSGYPALPYEVKTYPNDVTGEKEITLIPQVDGIPSTDTGVPSDNIPDTSGDVGEGWLDIPILGTILKWLMNIWQMIKDLYDLILQQFMNPSTADDGVDWGNFKGFFDIFYIFYYLIIIVILILLKFLAAVMNMMSIPANTALFDSYPTMLSGLNYIKGIKVGGFSITLQQIFDYMFTVFFFLFVVTVLQKLYHSFSSVERQQAREDREIIYKNSDYENIHYEDRR